LNSFLYADPSDSAVTAQNIGRATPRQRLHARARIGGYYEPVSYATAISSVTLNGSPTGAYTFTAPNTITFPARRGWRRTRLDRGIRLPLPLPRRPTGL